MMSLFASVFFACAIGLGVGQIVRWWLLAPERRHFGAAVVETLALALAVSSTELVFGVWPQLKEGWR